MDDETKKILKHSLLKTPSKNFTDRMMQRIHKEVLKQPEVDRDIKWSWFFMGLAILILPIGLTFLFNLLSIYDPYLDQYLPKFSNSVFLQLMIIMSMTLILLLQLDNLIRMTLDHKKQSHPSIPA